MPVRIRLSRGGAKKRPFYRIIIADSRRSRDGKFIDQIGIYNPMLSKDSSERVKLNAEKAKEWIAKGAQPSDRVKIFLSNLGIIEKPVITEKTKKHLPKKKEEVKEEAKVEPAKQEVKEEVKEEAKVEPAKEEVKEEVKEKPENFKEKDPRIKNKKKDEEKSS